MTHTPGPWRVGRPGSVVADHPVPEMDGSDAVDYYGGHLIAESVTAKNAPLLAAAPELLSAAKKLRRAVYELGLDPVDEDFCSILEQADIAIAKADGCDCITSGNVEKPKQHGADPHAKNCALYHQPTVQKEP